VDEEEEEPRQEKEAETRGYEIQNSITFGRRTLGPRSLRTSLKQRVFLLKVTLVLMAVSG